MSEVLHSIRAKALELAVQARQKDSEPSADYIIWMAKAFEQYLIGNR